MFAIIETGNKQYKVSAGNKIKIEKLEGDVGSEIVFDNILMLGDENGKVTTGKPNINGASVKAEILHQIRDDKIIVFKKKRRQNYRRKNGHRQYLSIVEIKQINA